MVSGHDTMVRKNKARKTARNNKIDNKPVRMVDDCCLCVPEVEVPIDGAHDSVTEYTVGYGSRYVKIGAMLCITSISTNMLEGSDKKCAIHTMSLGTALVSLCRIFI
jgi:hypothetical protein